MIRIDSAGGYDKLKCVDLPECGYTQGANIKLKSITDDDCVIVDKIICAVNYADVIIRWGYYKSATEFVGWPITPGFDFSGTVKWAGANVKNLKVGDKVAGISMFGAYSSCIKVPQHQVRRVPANLSMPQAAGFIAVAATAWYASHQLCRLRAGDWVLVQSAAGGVGGMLSQMLSNLKCNVVGVVGREQKITTAKELGCKHVIVKSQGNMWEEAKKYSPEGYAAIFDSNGVDTLQSSYDHLKAGGRLVAYGATTLMPRSTEKGSGSLSVGDTLKLAYNYMRRPTIDPLQMISENKSVMGFNLSFMFDNFTLIEEGLDTLFAWMECGAIKLQHITEYKLSDVAKAHRDLESGNTVGKLVLCTYEES